MLNLAKYFKKKTMPLNVVYKYYTFPSASPNTIGWSGGQIRQVTALC